MASAVSSRTNYICRACRAHQNTGNIYRGFSTTASRTASLREQLQTRDGKQGIVKKLEEYRDRALFQPKRPEIPVFERTTTPAEQKTPDVDISDLPQSIIENPQQTLHDTKVAVLNVLEQPTHIPADDEVNALFKPAQQLAYFLTYIPKFSVPTQSSQADQDASQSSPKSATLFGDLEEPANSERKPKSHSQPALSLSDRKTMCDELAKTFFTLLEDPKIYISESVLTNYTVLLATLGLPEYAPKIFEMYAHKPIPTPNSNPIKYRKPASQAPKYAIPLKLVDMIMDVAIAKKDMALCVAIIETTVATPQFKYAKLLRSASIPAIGAAGLVPITWRISSLAAEWQVSWDPDVFFWMCLGGGGAYLGTMGTLLFITATTWNDHHKRVRWIPGTPLARRWIKEEERAYFDRMAQTWGYQDPQKFGEEAGDQWDAFRAILALRYLDLDRTSLLPGML